MKRKQSMSVSLLHALFLFKRPTAKQDGCVAAEKNPEDFSALWGLRVLPDKQVVPSGHCLQRLFRIRNNESQIIKTPNKKVGDNQSPTEF